jgi:hypothetical protein
MDSSSAGGEQLETSDLLNLSQARQKDAIFQRAELSVTAVSGWCNGPRGLTVAPPENSN